MAATTMSARCSWGAHQGLSARRVSSRCRAAGKRRGRGYAGRGRGILQAAFGRLGADAALSDDPRVLAAIEAANMPYVRLGA
ncbi:hypothetical protein ACRAWD_29870 [Caulobacter segnis]